MRRLIWLAGLFALLWSGWWMFASFAIQSGLEAWLSDRRNDGWQADVAEVRVAGYPFQLDTQLSQPVLADPRTGLAFSTSRLELGAPAYAPGNLTVTFPDDEMIFASPLGRRTVVAQEATAHLRVAAGPSAEVTRTSLLSGPWVLLSDAGTLMAADGLIAEVDQDESVPTLYKIGIESPAFRPGEVPRGMARVPQDWPVAFDSLVLDMSVRFDRPIDRRTIEERRPQPEHIDLRVAEAIWGELSLRFSAVLDVSPDGLMTGEFSVQARNWRTLLDVAENTGTLPARLRPQIEQVLQALAQGTGNADALDLTLTLRDGAIFLGFIPLGEAPPLVIR